MSAVVLLVGLLILFSGAVTVGVSADEPFHLQRFTNWQHGGWYVADFQAKGGAPRPGVTDQYVYAPATMWLLHDFCHLVGVESGGQVSATAEAYVTRHIGVALISLVGVGAVGLIVRLILRRWGWALVAAAALVSVPLWNGHSMFNPKDPAVGSGYTLVTLALVWIARADRRRGWTHALGPTALAAGVWLAIGTRPAMWSGVAAGVVATVALCALRPRRGGGAWGWWRVAEIGIGLAAGYAGLVALYPRVFEDPVAMLTRSASNSADFVAAGSTASPFTVPLHVLFIMPLGVLTFVAVSTLRTFATLLRSRLRVGTRTIRISLVIVQMLAVPVVAMAKSTNVAGDVRQLLFATPAAAALAVVGIAQCLSALEAKRLPSARAVVACFSALTLVVPILAQAELFPYSYAAYNVLPDVAGTTATMPKDYYELSARAFAGDLKSGSIVICNPFESGAAKTTFVPYDGLTGSDDCRWDPTNVIGPWAAKPPELRPPTRERFQAVTFWDTASANCRPVRSLTRLLLWRRITLSTLWDCNRVYPQIGAQPVFQLAGFAGAGWYGNMSTQGGIASLAFRVAEDALQPTTLKLGLAGPSGQPPARAIVDGQSQPVAVVGDTVTIPIPAVPAGRLVRVALIPPAGARLSVTLTSLRLEGK